MERLPETLTIETVTWRLFYALDAQCTELLMEYGPDHRKWPPHMIHSVLTLQHAAHYLEGKVQLYTPPETTRRGG